LVILFGKTGVAEFVILIVSVNEVLNNGTRLPEGDVRVGVVDSCAKALVGILLQV
jgi:hypothetical protein